MQIYSYAKLEQILQARGISKTRLSKEAKVSSRTIAKIGKNEKIAHSVLEKIARYLGCLPDELFVLMSDNPILQRLMEEKSARVSGGLYHELQVRMTYNSNHMEGSKLSEEQTRLIFETSTITSVDGVPVDDIIETVHHFRAIDFCIDHAEELLTENVIKELHYILKHDTKDAELPWFNVGDYKTMENVVGGRETVKPKDVPLKIRSLLDAYGEKDDVDIFDIIAFHAEFERIHPFQDGNGRVGRLIILKECLRWGVVPFIIEDSKKAFYYRGLSEWNRERGYLVDTCLDGQDTFRRLMRLCGL